MRAAEIVKPFRKVLSQTALDEPCAEAVPREAHGLETCPQQAWCEYGRVVHEELGIPGSRILVSGMALGYADPEAPENSLVSERVPVEGFSEFLDV